MSAQVPSIYATEEVAKLTRLGVPLLRRWAREGFYKPTLGSSYSFRDVVSLRVLAVLRLDHGVSRQALVKAGQKLKSEADEPWATLRIGVTGKEIVFLDKRSGRFVSTKPHGQHVAEQIVQISEVRAAMTREATHLVHRPAGELGRFEKRRGSMAGAEVFAGTRIPVREVGEARQRGISEDRILRMFPALTPKDVRAAVEHLKQRQRRSA